MRNFASVFLEGRFACALRAQETRGTFRGTVSDSTAADDALPASNWSTGLVRNSSNNNALDDPMGQETSMLWSWIYAAILTRFQPERVAVRG